MESSKGSHLVQYFAVGFGALNIINTGMVYGWPSLSLPHFQDVTDKSVNFHITPSEGSWLAIAPLLGVLVGAPLAACTLDRLGRRKIILVTVFPYFVGWLIVSIAKEFQVLFAARFIAGIADGCVFTVMPMYIGEISSPNIRGILGSAIQVTLLIGIIVMNIIGSTYTVPTAALLASIVPALFFIGMLYMPESPYYLLMKNRTEEARAALRYLRGKEEVENELMEIYAAVKIEEQESRGTLKDLIVVPSNRKALLVVLLVRAAQQLSGLNSLIFYLPTILTEIGTTLPITSSTVFAFEVLLVAAIFGAVIVDTVGRRKLLICSSFGTVIALTIEGLYFQFRYADGVSVINPNLALIALIALLIFFGLGLHIVPVVMIGELFPTNIRSFSNCFEEVYTVVLGSLVAKIFQNSNTYVGVQVAFFSFAICSAICLLLIVVYVPETKGRSLGEIQALLRDNRGNPKPNVPYLTVRDG